MQNEAPWDAPLAGLRFRFFLVHTVAAVDIAEQLFYNARSSEKGPTMSTSIREQYEEAWHELCDLVASRNRLLRSLDAMARLAMDVSPAGGMVIEFDISRAEELVSQVDALTRDISTGMQKLNSYAEQCGASSVKWQNVALRTE